MPDPRYVKKGIVSIDAKVKDQESPVRFYIHVENERFSALNEEQQKAVLADGLSKLSRTKTSAIFSMNAGFSYEDEAALQGFDYGNIFVEAHIPYCLDFPNDYEVEVLLSPPNDAALVTLKKIWTHKARSDTKLSSEADFFAEDDVLHFKDSDILTPTIPLDPREGWEQNYTGTNIQRIKDRTGTFRFTRLYIQFNLTVNKEDVEDKDKSEILLAKIHNKSLEAVNRLIDSYRIVTKQEHITRLGKLSINMVYFHELKQGWNTLSANIEPATMNRSKKEIESIEKILASGERPKLHDLLALDAQNSFNNNDYTLAIVQSYQGLEIFLENFLIENLIARKSFIEADAIVYISKDNNWRTKTRLKELLEEITGHTVLSKDKTLWDEWCNFYDNVRNQVVHKGKEATKEETEKVLESNLKVISIVGSL